MLEELLGAGGQGEVWRAKDPLAPGTDRAIKLVNIESTGPAQLERVRREARQLVHLRHPSLLACFGLFEDLHHELLGIVMELADGQPLDDLLSDERLDERKCVLILAHVAGALSYVHQRGVVHRDVKLENVVVTKSFWDQPDDPATVKLIDFGIAVPTSNPRPITQVGHVIGTPGYLAPEQLDPAHRSGGSSASSECDVFAFGVLAWKLMALDADAHPTGLPARARLEQYASEYRRREPSEWPQTEMRQAFQKFFSATLAISPKDRAKDGLALLRLVATLAPEIRLRTAEQAAPVAVRGGRLAPGPGGTAGSSVEFPTGSTEPCPNPVTPQPSAVTVPGEPPLFGDLPVRPASPPRQRTAKRASATLVVPALVVTAGLVLAGGAASYWFFAEELGVAVPRLGGSADPFPGAHCESDDACRLDPKSRWNVRPWAVTIDPSNFAAGAAVRPELCLRSGTDWKCAVMDDAQGTGGFHTPDGPNTRYVFSTGPQVPFSSRQLLLDGLDVQVRTAGEHRVVRRGLRPAGGPAAREKFFKEGLRFRLGEPTDDGVKEVVFELQYLDMAAE
ncbi:MAG: protein kinase [Myxococcales bacterium]|nr:protein kinase [Myxococcales bacterium]